MRTVVGKVEMCMVRAVQGVWVKEKTTAEEPEEIPSTLMRDNDVNEKQRKAAYQRDKIN
jgi:hypothetical protein